MHTKQKILVVITKGNWGGAQKYVYELATRLPKDDYEIVVAHGWGDILPAKLKEQSIRTVHIPQLGRDISLGKDSSSFFALFSLFRKERPHIVHLNSSKIGGLGALAARCARIPKIIFTVHGFAFNENRSPLQKAIIKFVSWITIILSTDVICISQKELTVARAWPYTAKKLHLIYNGISTPAFKERNESRKILTDILKQSADFFTTKTIIGSIGELTANKGFVYAISALKEVEHIMYIIIGTGEQKELLQQKINESQSKHKIFLAGFIDEASTLLPAFDMILVPSLKEGIPYVILESGAAEVPIITTTPRSTSNDMD